MENVNQNKTKITVTELLFPHTVVVRTHCSGCISAQF